MTDKWIWVDLETFGLDPQHDPILEVGVTVTTRALEVVDQIGVLVWDEVTHAPRLHRLEDEARDSADARWVLDMHTTSGLLADCRALGVPNSEAIETLRGFLEGHKVDGHSMCGSSVHFDRAMLDHQMPSVLALFGYRNVDVSTVKTLCQQYNPDAYEAAKLALSQEKAHRALSDLDSSIAELRFYLEHFLYVSQPALLSGK